MKPINNFENVKANDGELNKPIAGGYICKIIDVENVELNPNTNKGNYLKIAYDIATGDFANYYKSQFDRFGGDWYAKFIRSYKETAIGMFKHFINCVEASNEGFVWDWSEKELIGKYVGLILGEEEYKNSNGEIKTKLIVKNIKTVDEIKNNDFKIPTLKRLNITGLDPLNGLKPIGTDDLSDVPF